MATKAELDALRGFIQAASVPGGVSPENVRQAIAMAENLNVSPATLSQMTGGSLSEQEVRSVVKQVSPNSKILSGFKTGQLVSPSTTNSDVPVPVPPPQLDIPPINSIEGGLQIPDFMKPFLNVSNNFSLNAMHSLGDLLARPNALVAPFNPLQIQSQNLAAGVANGIGGFLPQAQEVFREIADPTDIVDTYKRGYNLLTQSQGRNALGGIAGNALDPSFTATANNTLQNTARGDYLFGTPAFNAAVDASIRQAKPHIMSQFAKGGSGAVSGGLAKIGMQQAASDSFARLYGQERERQLGASNRIGQFALDNIDRRLSASNALLGADQRAGSILTSMADADRDRQFSAAAQLPQMGLLQSNILGSVGDRRQQQSLTEKQGAVQQYQQLLNSAYGNINPTALFAGTQPVGLDRNRAMEGLGGAFTGSALGSNLFPASASFLGLGAGPWGAIVGGLLGAFG